MFNNLKMFRLFRISLLFCFPVLSSPNCLASDFQEAAEKIMARDFDRRDRCKGMTETLRLMKSDAAYDYRTPLRDDSNIDAVLQMATWARQTPAELNESLRLFSQISEPTKSDLADFYLLFGGGSRDACITLHYSALQTVLVTAAKTSDRAVIENLRLKFRHWLLTEPIATNHRDVLNDIGLLIQASAIEIISLSEEKKAKLHDLQTKLKLRHADFMRSYVSQLRGIQSTAAKTPFIMENLPMLRRVMMREFVCDPKVMQSTILTEQSDAREAAEQLRFIVQQ